ncbi:MAG: DUF4416 family protein [candidate division Zixibacteria bacterium]|nr:DUF4416 family protein [candidate division Zixibacteria bacterium]
MASPEKIDPVMLIAGFLYSDPVACEQVAATMAEQFGDVQCDTGQFDFTGTDYYDREMGSGLKRRFVSFGNPIAPDRLKEIKIFTNRLERQYLRPDGGRVVNIDPGTVGLAGLVLVSTKNFSHRIYLGDGIFGEISLLYENKAFVPLKWTYPDYRLPEVMGFLTQVRENVKKCIGVQRLTQ